MTAGREILICYYGDDFTGSADVMESLSLMGTPTILFLNPPTVTEIENFTWKRPEINEGRYISIGVAGISRSLDSGKIKSELDPIFQQMAKLPSKYFHYKICSTLDSSPETGNIGMALDLAERYFPSPFIPMVMGPPSLNRFVVFGNLFARIGAQTFRLDRHPVMSKHPVTPMFESDIRRHLAKQMDRQMALVDYFGLKKLDDTTIEDILGKKHSLDKAPLILFDTLEDHHLFKIGNWIHTNSGKKHQLLLGSSAIEYALGHVYGEKVYRKSTAQKITPTLIVAGSCSQNTADQLNHIASLGYAMVKFNVPELFGEDDGKSHIQNTVNTVLGYLFSGRNTALFTAMGPEDPSVRSIHSNDPKKEHAHRIAAVQGEITRRIIDKFPLKRLVTAGGDTSGYILKDLGIKALEFKNEIAIGAPLCIAHADKPSVDGLEIAVKGGQNGTTEYFENAQKGGL